MDNGEDQIMALIVLSAVQGNRAIFQDVEECLPFPAKLADIK